MTIRRDIRESAIRFNEKFPIGTAVAITANGAEVKTKTWSHAGQIGTGKNVCCGVFVESQQEPVAISRLVIGEQQGKGA